MTIREWSLARLQPSWLQGPIGGRLIYGALSLVGDVCADLFLRAAYAGAISHPLSPDDVLPLVGKDRGGLSRYPLETIQAYRTRLLRARDDWDYAGSGTAIINQFAAAGYPGVQIITYPWREGPHGEPPPYWSQFWVRFPAGSHPVTRPGPAWGSMVWGQFVWGNCTIPKDFAILCRALVEKWRDASCVCRGFEFQLTTDPPRWGTMVWGDFVWGGYMKMDNDHGRNTRY